MRRAVLKAGLTFGEIGYINAHGNGIAEYDIGEMVAIKRVFGKCAHKIPISSIKPLVGQSFSATGIFQLITCLMAINENIVPPTMNLKKARTKCALNHVLVSPTPWKVDAAMMNTHGFGGSHTVLIVGRYTD
jgi:3-oxoacyl-[acyl-carrier-protein] synthase II